MIHLDPASIALSPPSTAPRALVERQVAALARLAEIGMEIAEAAGRAATTAPADAAPPGAEAPFCGDPVLAYTRAARAVRQTFALQSRLLAELAALEADARATETRLKRERSARLRDLVTRAVKDDVEFDEPFSMERFAHEARERLDDAEDDADLDGAPVAEVVARICGDLGLSPEWTARLVTAVGGSIGPSCSGAAEWPARGAALVRGPDGAPPEDDGWADTFLEWPPPSG